MAATTQLRTVYEIPGYEERKRILAEQFKKVKVSK